MKKQFLSPRTNGKRLYITFDLADNFSSAAKMVANCRNVALRGTKVVNTKGIVAHSYTGKVLQLVGHMQGHTFLLTPQGIGALADNTFTHYYDLQSTHLAFCHHQGMAVFSSSQNGTFTKEEDLDYISSSSPQGYDSIASAGGRVWGVEGRLLHCTDVATDVVWEKGETINLPEPCTLVASSGNKLYAMGEEVFLVETDGDLVEIKIKKVGSYGKVKSAVNSKHNGKLYFATTSGLYVMEHNGAHMVATWPSGVADVQLVANSTGIIANLIYASTSDTHLVEYHIPTDSFVSVRRVQVQGILQAEQLLAVQNGVLTQCTSDYAFSQFVMDTPLPYQGKTHFLRNLYVNTAHDLDVVLTTEKGSHTYKLAGKVGVQAIPLCGKCKSLQLLLRGTIKTDVSHLALEVVCYDI